MLYVVNLILIKHTIFSTLLPRNTTTGTTVMHNNMQSMLRSPRFGFDLIQYGCFVRKANLVVLKISRATVHASIDGVPLPLAEAIRIPHLQGTYLREHNHTK